MDAIKRKEEGWGRWVEGKMRESKRRRGEGREGRRRMGG